MTEGKEIKSHDLFAKLTSKKTITGEDEPEERVLEYLTEIRDVRDKSSESFDKKIYGAPVVRKNSIQLLSDRDVGTYLFGLRDLETREASSAGKKYPSA